MTNKQTIRKDENYARSVCARLKVLRTGSGFTEPDVAERLDIPTALYMLYEEYVLVPHQLIAPLCVLLNVSPWHYLTGISEEESPPIQRR